MPGAAERVANPRPDGAERNGVGVGRMPDIRRGADQGGIEQDRIRPYRYVHRIPGRIIATAVDRALDAGVDVRTEDLERIVPIDDRVAPVAEVGVKPRFLARVPAGAIVLHAAEKDCLLAWVEIHVVHGDGREPGIALLERGRG
jgi:hypothetical protein